MNGRERLDDGCPKSAVLRWLTAPRYQTTMKFDLQSEGEERQIMRRNFHLWAMFSALILGRVFSLGSPAAMAATTADEEAAYTRTITERADKIVAPLALDDTAKATRVR